MPYHDKRKVYKVNEAGHVIELLVIEIVDGYFMDEFNVPYYKSELCFEPVDVETALLEFWGKRLEEARKGMKFAREWLDEQRKHCPV